MLVSKKKKVPEYLHSKLEIDSWKTTFDEKEVMTEVFDGKKIMCCNTQNRALFLSILPFVSPAYSKSFFSALQLNDDIHLSLSPEPEDDQVFDEVDLNSSSSKNNNGNGNSENNDIPEGIKLAYRDAKSVPNMTKSSSWYDGLMGCLKPVMSSMMGKQKSSNSQSDAAGN